jgi:hypothetical protein
MDGDRVSIKIPGLAPHRRSLIGLAPDGFDRSLAIDSRREPGQERA